MHYHFRKISILLLPISAYVSALPTQSPGPGTSPNLLLKRAPFALTPAIDRQQGGVTPRVTDITIDCWLSEDLQYICNADCHAILCLRRPDVLKRDSDATRKRARRTAVGRGGITTYGGTDLQVTNKHLHRPEAAFNSPEEYPFAATWQGGTGLVEVAAVVEGGYPTYTMSDVYDSRYHAVIYPATQTGQTHRLNCLYQGWSLLHAYGGRPAGVLQEETNHHFRTAGGSVNDGEWFRPHFDSYKPWCIKLENFRNARYSEETRRTICNPDYEGYTDPYQPSHIGSVKDSVKGTQIHFSDALAGKGAFGPALSGGWTKRNVDESDGEGEFEPDLQNDGMN